ncbi:MAG: hypothetical protein E6K16_05015 [Methanobacteriota archaeon]|nr:MAG: hypothetical protein E6K16_05015 [Euryarchaeota archaeon]
METPEPRTKDAPGAIAVLWVMALLVAASPWLAVPVRVLGGPLSLSGLFVFAAIAATAALVIAGAGLLLVFRSRGYQASFVIAFVLLLLNLVADALAVVVWFSLLTCSGGQSGPCMTPLVLCGGGLAVTAIAVPFTAIGLLMLRRTHQPPATPPSVCE